MPATTTRTRRPQSLVEKCERSVSEILEMRARSCLSVSRQVCSLVGDGWSSVVGGRGCLRGGWRSGAPERKNFVKRVWKFIGTWYVEQSQLQFERRI